MKRFALRLPDDLHEQLKEVAEGERRSLHAQILWLLERGLEGTDGGQETVVTLRAGTPTTRSRKQDRENR